MKESDRRTLGMNINLSYRRKKWDVRNQLSLSSTKSHDTPFGSFQEYANLNPYYRKDKTCHFGLCVYKQGLQW